MYVWPQNLLDHVEDGLVFPQPDVVVRYRHRLKCDILGVLEKRVWTPDLGEPLDG